MYTPRPWRRKRRPPQIGTPLPFEDVMKMSKHLRKKEKEEFNNFEEGYDELVEDAFGEEETEEK